jgi:hypothetical protein
MRWEDNIQIDLVEVDVRRMELDQDVWLHFIVRHGDGGDRDKRKASAETRTFKTLR